jgi:hypothetical protein
MRGRGGGGGGRARGTAAPHPIESIEASTIQRTEAACYGRAMTHARTFALAMLLTLAGCSSSPANVAGSYTVSLTNSTNGCMFMNWDGMSTTGVPLDITQNGTAATATVGGLAGTYYDVIFGSHVMVGNVSGSHMDFVIHGTTHDSCGATLDAHATVELVGDTLTNGTITYQYANVSSTCAAYWQTCTSEQLFNGTRPPSR